MSDSELGWDGPFGTLIESRLRVLTWNIWWRYGPWERRWPAILATIERLDPDVIALQEVWSDAERNQAEVLATALGYHASYHARSVSAEGIGFGNALLARWPLLRTATWDLPAPGHAEEKRVVVHAEVDGPRGVIPVFSTHLNWRLEHSDVRQDQVRSLARFVASREPGGYPPIVCGDFNAAPGSEEIRMVTGHTTCAAEGLVFRDAWEDGGDGGAGSTWTKVNPYARKELEPDRRIDYIFVGPPRAGGAGHVVHCQVAGDAPVDGVWPSDHLGVCAALRY